MLLRYIPWLCWVFAVWGVLKVHELRFASYVDICGPWGCGPPIEALIAIHGAWMIFLLPAAYLMSIKFTSQQLRKMALVLILLGVLGIIFVGIYQSATWLQETRPSLREYFLRRWGFSILMLTDVPILQSVLFGLIFASASRLKRKAAESEILDEALEMDC